MKKETIWNDEEVKVKKEVLNQLNKKVEKIYKSNIENKIKKNILNKTKELDITYIKLNSVPNLLDGVQLNYRRYKNANKKQI